MTTTIERARASFADRTSARPGPASLVGSAAVAVFVLWQVLGSDDPASRQRVSDMFPLGLEVLTLVVLVLRARRADPGRSRWAWGLVAVAHGFYFLGDASWAYLELVRNRSPFPSMADVPYLAFYPAMLAGLLLLPGPTRRRSEWGRLGLDTLTVTIAGSMTIWYLVIGPTLETSAGVNMATTLSIAYPAFDLVLVFGVASVAVRAADPANGLRWLAIGATAFVVGDVGFAASSLNGTYQAGSWPDTLWLVALVCSIVAAERPAADQVVVRSERRVGGPRLNLLPYLAIAASFGLLLHVGFSQAGATIRTLLLLVLALTVTVVARQITALRDNLAMTEELRRLATTDALTDLANRRRVIDVAGRRLDEAADGDDLSLIYIDVDHFKHINDEYGHAVGDAVLVWLGEQLRQETRTTDLVGRYGGDEFVVIAPGLDGAEALAVATRLARTVAAAVDPVEGGPRTVELSLGVASADGVRDVDELLTRADIALYQAKRDGRGRAHLLDAGQQAQALA